MVDVVHTLYACVMIILSLHECAELHGVYKVLQGNLLSQQRSKFPMKIVLQTRYLTVCA